MKRPDDAGFNSEHQYPIESQFFLRVNWHLAPRIRGEKLKRGIYGQHVPLPVIDVNPRNDSVWGFNAAGYFCASKLIPVAVAATEQNQRGAMYVWSKDDDPFFMTAFGYKPPIHLDYFMKRSDFDSDRTVH